MEPGLPTEDTPGRLDYERTVRVAHGTCAAILTLTRQERSPQERRGICGGIHP